jgi:predicted nucleic acid-binding protein
LHSPDIFPAEIANALLVAEQRGRIADFRPVLQDVLTTCPRLHASIPLLPRVAAIVSLARVSIYDALYVALADREGCELVTAATRLINNLGKHFPFILPLAALP